jgi:hypothetical protein
MKKLILLIVFQISLIVVNYAQNCTYTDAGWLVYSTAGIPTTSNWNTTNNTNFVAAAPSTTDDAFNNIPGQVAYHNTAGRYLGITRNNVIWNNALGYAQNLVFKNTISASACDSIVIRVSADDRVDNVWFNGTSILPAPAAAGWQNITTIVVPSTLITDGNNYICIQASDVGGHAAWILAEVCAMPKTCCDKCFWTVNGNNIVGNKNIFGTLNNSDVRIFTNNTQRATVLATGQVGIGTPTPLHTLHLRKLPTWGGYTLFSDSRNQTNQNSNCNWDNAAFIVNGDYSKGIIVGKGLGEDCQDNAPWQETFHVYGNGFVEAAAYGVFSDKRFKKDIKTIENGLDVVKKLDGVSYKFNFELATNANASGKSSYGFIAQEVEKIIPDAVLKNKDGFYSVNYDAIIPFLTNAIKEQQKHIEKLETQIQKMISQTTSNKDVISNSSEGYLTQNTPNPFSNSTEIKYQLPKATQTAILGIYDLNGKQVKIYSINVENNTGSIIVSAGELQAGMYIYTLVINGKAFDSKRMVLTAQ